MNVLVVVCCFSFVSFLVGTSLALFPLPLSRVDLVHVVVASVSYYVNRLVWGCQECDKVVAAGLARGTTRIPKYSSAVIFLQLITLNH